MKKKGKEENEMEKWIPNSPLLVKACKSLRILEASPFLHPKIDSYESAERRVQWILRKLETNKKKKTEVQKIEKKLGLTERGGGEVNSQTI